MLLGRRIGFVLIALVAMFPFPSSAVPIQTFEDGLLTGWTPGGRQISGSGNWWGVTDRNASKMAYLQHTSFTELTLSRTFAYEPNMVISFDAEFYIDGDTSPSASGSSDFYNAVSYSLELLDAGGSSLGYRAMAAATSNLPYANPAVFEFTPNGLQHYEYAIADLASDLGVTLGDVSSVTLTFSGYSSWWSGSDMRVYFDNVATQPIPEPSTALLVGGGLAGLAMKRRRGRSGRR